MIGDIGKTAGAIWKFLKDNGPQSLTSLTKGVKSDRNSLHWGIGWLAREGKLEIVKEKGKFTFSLSKEEE